MRGLVIVALSALLALPLLAAVPTADAFGWCTSVGPDGHRCREYTVCIGWGWDSRGERCQYGVRDGEVPPVCDVVTCHWPPPPQ